MYFLLGYNLVMFHLVPTFHSFPFYLFIYLFFMLACELFLLVCLDIDSDRIVKYQVSVKYFQDVSRLEAVVD